MPRPFLYLTYPQTEALTTVARFVAETGSSADTDLIQRLIERTSGEIEGRLDRKLARAQVTDRWQGVGLKQQVLTLPPLIDVVEVRNDGDAQDLTEIEPLSETGEVAGILFNPARFSSTLRPLWEADYWGGYLLPSDDVSATDISAASADNSFNRASGKWPLLRPDDRIIVGGFDTAALNDSWKVVSRTDAKVIVDGTLSDDANAGSPPNTITVAVSTLPDELERACVILALNALQVSGQTAEGLVKVGERVGDLSVTWAQKEGMKTFESLLSRYRSLL